MELQAGTTLGPFEIQRRIGEGGMGVVYRAVDSRLGRTVAIKVLADALRGDPDRLRRFEQEARTLGSLNHANLVTLHEVGHHEGMPYLVTELLEGQSLRARMTEGKLALEDTVRIACEIAQGLAAAHGAGITHRDIKPENVFVTTDDRVKVLDFGIAKLATTATTVDGDAATVDDTSTATGSIVGTPGYMAPEQLAGQHVDPRTDLFALGVLIYEMLVGKRPFAAETGVEESYGTLKSSVRELPAEIPPHVARIVRRCLEKRPEARFQSASDLAFALETTPPPAAAIAKPPPPKRRFGMGAILGLAIVAAALVLVLVPKPHPPTASTATSWPTLVEGGPLYHRITFDPQPQSFARFAPDGRSVLWSLRRDGKWHVMSSELATPSVLDLQLEGRLLDVSRSGELALRSAEEGDGGTLVRVRPGAGSPRGVVDHIKDAAWGTDDDSFAVVHDAGGPTLEYPVGTTVLHHPHGGFTLVRVSHDGRVALCETDAPPDTHGHVLIVDHGAIVATSATYPTIDGLAWSADGREVWFSTDRTVRAIDLSGHERILMRTLLRAELRDVDAAGHILIAPTEVRAHTFSGPHDQVPHEVSWFDSSNVYALSADGTAIAFLENTEAQQTADGYAAYVRIGEAKPVAIGHARALTLLPDASAVIAITSPTGLARVPINAGAPVNLPRGKIAKLDVSDHPAMSWDGRHVVVRGAEAGDQPMRLWLLDLNGGDPAPIGPAEVRPGLHPISAEGTLVAIANPAGGIRVISLVGGPEKLIGKGEEEPVGWSVDGALYVMALHRVPRKVERYDFGTQARTPWVTIAPEGKPKLVHVALDASGQDVAWSLVTELSDLYVVEPPAH